MTDTFFGRNVDVLSKNIPHPTDVPIILYVFHSCKCVLL
jgi:hypothetical protein